MVRKKIEVKHWHQEGRKKKRKDYRIIKQSWLVGWSVFRDVSTLVVYLMPNPVFIYTCYVSELFVVTSLLRVVRAHLFSHN